MANVYVYSGAGGAGTGADWANAYTTLAAAFTGGAAGDTFWVADDHAETQASAMTITVKGSAASPCRVICALRSGGSVPPVSADLRTTATITTTGANNLTIGGASVVCYFEGITFSAGTGAVNNTLNVNAGSRFYFRNCGFKKLGTTATTQAIAFNSSAQYIELDNCTFEMGSATDAILSFGQLVWKNTPSTAYAGATIPTTGMFSSNTTNASVWLEALDLSALGSGNTIVRAPAGPQRWVIKDCKLGSSVTIAATPTDVRGRVDAIRCDSGDTNYRTESYQYQGTLTTETTTVRTGGASDGTTTIAWKVVPTANNERTFPFECFPISIWNETTGSSVTLTIEGTWGGGAVPTTNDIWMDVEYLGTSGFPLGSSTNGNVDILATGTNHTSSSETWGAGGTTKFKMSVSVTPQEKGPIRVYIKYANATNTVWIDPRITLS